MFCKVLLIFCCFEVIKVLFFAKTNMPPWLPDQGPVNTGTREPEDRGEMKGRGEGGQLILGCFCLASSLSCLL